MHLGYGSGDCSIAGCTVESPCLLSTLVQHTRAHLSVLYLELSVSYETLFVHIPILFDNVFASLKLQDALLIMELDAGVGIGCSCQCPLGRKLGGSRISLNTVAKIIMILLLVNVPRLFISYPVS
jgi:hypothetical protein